MDRLVSRDTEQLSDAKTTVARHHGAGARITDPDLLHRYLDVRDVDKIEIEDDPDLAFIDHLSERYMHTRPYANHHPGDQRIGTYIRPMGSSAMAG